MKAIPLLFALSAGMWGVVLAEEDPAFEKASLGWRTALHFDPGGEAPLQSLVQLYERQGKINDLLSLYAQHVVQFPQDVGAKVVLARLYLHTRDVRADAFLDDAVNQHPGQALLLYARARRWMAKMEPRGLDELDRAVAVETDAARCAKWLGELLEAAASVRREDLVVTRFKALATDGVLVSGQRLQWARRALELGLTKVAETVMAEADLTQLSADEEVEARFVAGRVALALGRKEDAARQAAALLERLAPDHWRYREAVSLRWQTAADAQDREAILAQMKQRWREAPQSETAALGLGDVLATAERKEEALKVWREALERLPESKLLEERILELLEQLRRGDEAIEFLTGRVVQYPGREDLVLKKARTLLQMGRVEEGLKALAALAAQKPENQTPLYLQTARWLRARHLVGEAARVMETLVAAEPERWEARKELAELYVVLKRNADVEALFAVDPPESLPPEIRLEVAQFLMAQKLWEPARRLLGNWLEREKAEFDGRLLLAKLNFLLGDESTANGLLEQCRELADTDVRYAAWLAVAWEQAGERERTREFVSAERERLWPREGQLWDAPRLAKLSLLAQQTMQPDERADAEKLLRLALAVPDLPAAEREQLRLQLIQTLSDQKGREKDLESELKAALAEKGARKGDLQLRLGVLYAEAKRHDLAKAALSEVDAGACEDASLMRRAISVAEQLALTGPVRALYERLVRLQPDERAHWVAWSSLMIEQRDEAGLRLALREIQSRAAAWSLSQRSQEQVRQHLAASYWRTVAALLAREEAPGDWLRPALSALDELERLEVQVGRQLWAVWARGITAQRLGEKQMMEQAIEQIEKSGVEWVEFPDGLSLPVHQAGAVIRDGGIGAADDEPAHAATSAPPMAPLRPHWTYRAAGGADLLRWDLTADGAGVVVADTVGRAHLLDRSTGKLMWQQRLPKAQGETPSVEWMMRHGGESVQQPPEWVVGERVLAVLGQDGLWAYDLASGRMIWRSAGAAPGGAGCLARAGKRILWWRPVEGRVEAYEEDTGKLAWSRDALPPWKPRANANGEPPWIGAGIHVDRGRALIWAEGGAVLRLNDGALLSKALAGAKAPAFPLELASEESTPSTSLVSPTVTPWLPTQNIYNRRIGGGWRMSRGPVIFANPLASPGFGYPGMFAGGQYPQVITWGIDDVRRLSGGGIWRISSGAVQAYSVLGLPLRTNLAAAAPIGSVVGSFGDSLVGLMEGAAYRWHPARGGLNLWTKPAQQMTAGSGQTTALPSAAIAGRLLLLATQERLRAQDVVNGTVVWDSPWPEEVKGELESGKETMSVWQSVRWSGRGVFFNDNQRRTLGVDWKALTAGQDWVVPVGTKTLVCLRGAGAGVDSRNEQGDAN
jgi:thioredoxin-like negative regulator of GroEL